MKQANRNSVEMKAMLRGAYFLSSRQLLGTIAKKSIFVSSTSTSLLFIVKLVKKGLRNLVNLRKQQFFRSESDGVLLDRDGVLLGTKVKEVISMLSSSVCLL